MFQFIPIPLQWLTTGRTYVRQLVVFRAAGSGVMALLLITINGDMENPAAAQKDERFSTRSQLFYGTQHKLQIVMLSAKNSQCSHGNQMKKTLINESI